MDKDKLILAVLILGLLVVDYPLLDSAAEKYFKDYETVHIDRVIDGDTIVSNGTSIRLLGINTPEKGELYSSEAKEFLESRILNKSVNLKFGKEKYDLYNRTLAYVFLGNKNINKELVKNGLANFYFPSGKDAYYKSFYDSWEQCLEDNNNLCEKSKEECVDCIELQRLNVDAQEVILYNSCSFTCDLTDWRLKDEGRKNFVFPETKVNGGRSVIVKVEDGENDYDLLFWEGESYVWTKSGDTLFLRDAEGKLVLWESY